MGEAGPARVVSSDIRSVAQVCHGSFSSIRGREGCGLGRHVARAMRDGRGERWESDTTDSSKASQKRCPDISDVCPDTITGNAAEDQLTGGLGTDSYVYNNSGAAFVDANADVITGFGAGGLVNFDILRFIDSADLQLAGAANITFQAANTVAFTAAAGNNVIVITDAVAANTGAGIEAALVLINATNNGAVANGAIIVAAAAAGNAKVWYDAGVGAGNSVELAELAGLTLAGLGDFVTGNFAVVA